MKNGDKPAFAMQAHFDDQFGPIQQEPGLTKREYFAAMAMQGVLAANWISINVDGTVYNHEVIAKVAITVADELLKQLES